MSRGGRRISSEWLENFGTESCPIRPSTIGVILGCSWRRVAVLAGYAMDEDKQAAQTGSLMHLGIAEWHKSGQKMSAKEVYDIINKGMSTFPLADAMDAKLMAQTYMRHEINRNAKCVHVEQGVTFRVPPADHDKTQKEIVIEGTLDQVRLTADSIHKEGDRLFVWDIKTTKFPPNRVIPNYLLQLAAYAFAASQTFNEDIEMGGFIFPRLMLKDNYGFIPARVNKAYFHSAFRTLANKIAEIRNGHISNTPGDVCTYCWAMSSNGFDTCSYLLDRKRPLEVVSSEQRG